jgi:hypothetical protein
MQNNPMYQKIVFILQRVRHYRILLHSALRRHDARDSEADATDIDKADFGIL